MQARASNAWRLRSCAQFRANRGEQQRRWILRQPDHRRLDRIEAIGTAERALIGRNNIDDSTAKQLLDVPDYELFNIDVGWQRRIGDGWRNALLIRQPTLPPSTLPSYGEPLFGTRMRCRTC